MEPNAFLPFNVALAFYNVGTIWAHEIDIFRTWKLINPKDFSTVQTAHWRKLPYWIFTPVGIAFAGGIALIWYHPRGSLLWGRWQALLSRDPQGSHSRYLDKILATHWIRTMLISGYAVILLAWLLN